MMLLQETSLDERYILRNFWHEFMMGKTIEWLIHVQQGLASTCIRCWRVTTYARRKSASLTRLKAIPLLY
jgi:hypothetical protein